jgi:hypothetical protein
LRPGELLPRLLVRASQRQLGNLGVGAAIVNFRLYGAHDIVWVRSPLLSALDAVRAAIILLPPG